VQGTSCRYAPVAFAGHLPALLARRVPVRATAVAGDVVLAHPEPVLQEEILEETHDRRISLPQLKFN